MNKFSYPVFLSLANKDCLIVGFGAVGRRKLAGILKCGPASITVIDLHFHNLDEELANNQAINFEQRNWLLKDIQKSFIVFATTNDKNENARIALACQKENILCNTATDPDIGNFIVPAILREQSLYLALSTGGNSPLLAKKLKSELKPWLRQHSLIVWLLGQFRPYILKYFLPDEHVKIFEDIILSDFTEWLKSGEYEKCKQWLMKTCPCFPLEIFDQIIDRYEHDLI